MTKGASIDGPFGLVARRVGTTTDNPEYDYSNLVKSVAFMRVLGGFSVSGAHHAWLLAGSGAIALLSPFQRQSLNESFLDRSMS